MACAAESPTVGTDAGQIQDIAAPATAALLGVTLSQTQQKLLSENFQRLVCQGLEVQVAELAPGQQPDHLAPQDLRNLLRGL